MMLGCCKQCLGLHMELSHEDRKWSITLQGLICTILDRNLPKEKDHHGIWEHPRDRIRREEEKIIRLVPEIIIFKAELFKGQR